MKLNAKAKILAVLGITSGVAAYLAATTKASDWRYARLLATNLTKMPFRYFV